jgi:hypothetical protein
MNGCPLPEVVASVAGDVVNSVGVENIVLLALTGAIALANALMWLATKRNVEITKKNVEVLSRQTSYLESVSRTQVLHGITEAHKTTFLTLLSNKDMLTILASDAKMAPEVYAESYISGILINHSSDIYRAFMEGHLDKLSHSPGLE